MSDRDTYDPIPSDVRLAWENLREVAAEHGFRTSPPLLHTSAKLEHGEDRFMTGGYTARFWPECGAGADTMIVASHSPTPTPLERAMQSLSPSELRTAADVLDAKGVTE